MRAFTVQGERPARSLDEVLARMEALGAVADECEAVRRIVGIFLRWAERRQQTPDRTSGIAWLRAVSERLEPERQACVKACLATWFHLTGGARVGKQSWVGQPAGQSVGGRMMNDHHDLHARDEPAGRGRPQPARRPCGLMVLVKSLRRICRHRHRAAIRRPSIARWPRVVPHRKTMPAMILLR